MGKGETSFIEVGPGNVLTKLIEKIRQEPPPAEPAKLEVSAAGGGRLVEGIGRAVEKKLLAPESWLPRPTNGNGNGYGHGVGHQIVKPSSAAASRGITASTKTSNRRRTGAATCSPSRKRARSGRACGGTRIRCRRGNTATGTERQ